MCQLSPLTHRTSIRFCTQSCERIKRTECRRVLSQGRLNPHCRSIVDVFFYLLPSRSARLLLSKRPLGGNSSFYALAQAICSHLLLILKPPRMKARACACSLPKKMQTEKVSNITRPIHTVTHQIPIHLLICTRTSHSTATIALEFSDEITKRQLYVHWYAVVHQTHACLPICTHGPGFSCNGIIRYGISRQNNQATTGGAPRSFPAIERR